jgi:hypothetical protein
MSCLPQHERRVTFYAQSLGIKLHRGTDGKVRVVEVKSLRPDHGGHIQSGDVLCEVTGVIDLRNQQVSNQLWGDVIRTIKVAPRPLELVVSSPRDQLSRKSCVECELDAFGLKHSSHGNKNIDSCRDHRRVPTETAKKNENTISNGVRRTRSMTPPRHFIPSLLGRKDSKKTYCMQNTSNVGTFKSSTVAKNLKKATSCLIPQELRELGGAGGRLPEYDGGRFNASLNSGNWETQIECTDFQYMMLVSNISMDDELQESHEVENARYDNRVYQQGVNPQRLCQEEYNENPPLYQHYVDVRRETSIRRTSF